MGCSSYSSIFPSRPIHHGSSRWNPSLAGSSGSILSATYNIPAGEYENFFDVYTAGLRDAFVDLTVEHGELLTIIHEVFD